MKNLIIFILLIGIFYRLIMTAGGNFIFNMDNARDMVDIREMVVLLKPRLIAHTAAIEGVFYGPYWYYMSVVPFLLTQGDPYGSILMEIVLWTIGGYFLLVLAKRFGFLAVIFAGSVWLASDFVLLANRYAFNPNPALFLTPLLIYLIDKYMTTKKTLYSILCCGLSAIFFSFEIIFAIALPLILLLVVLITNNQELFKKRSFWLGVITFLLVLSPQLLFEIRHDFLMTNSVINYFSQVSQSQRSNLFERIIYVMNSFYFILIPTFINSLFLVKLLMILFGVIILHLFKKKLWQSNQIALITVVYIFIPIIIYILIPTTINSWHWVAIVGATIVFASFVIGYLNNLKITGKLIAVLITFITVVTAINSMVSHIRDERGPNTDVSSYKNEVAAIDYIYERAQGKNFKVYTYMPSVIDYPYQYLLWWYGQKKYGYVPGEYAYSRNKPQYISNKEKFEGRKDNFSNLVFLIKEPDRIQMRVAWEGDFRDLKLISIEKVGSIEIEVREVVDQ